MTPETINRRKLFAMTAGVSTAAILTALPGGPVEASASVRPDADIAALYHRKHATESVRSKLDRDDEAVRDTIEELDEQIDALETEISDAPAESPRGILIKLALADDILGLSHEHRRFPESGGERLFMSAMEDARRLSEPTAAADGFPDPLFDKDAERATDYWRLASQEIPVRRDQDKQIEQLWEERERLVESIAHHAEYAADAASGSQARMAERIKGHYTQELRELDEQIVALHPQHWWNLAKQAVILAVAFHSGKRNDELAGIVARRLIRMAHSGPSEEAAQRLFLSPAWQDKAKAEAAEAKETATREWDARMERNNRVRQRERELQAADA